MNVCMVRVSPLNWDAMAGSVNTLKLHNKRLSVKFFEDMTGRVCLAVRMKWLVTSHNPPSIFIQDFDISLESFFHLNHFISDSTYRALAAAGEEVLALQRDKAFLVRKMLDDVRAITLDELARHDIGVEIVKAEYPAPKTKKRGRKS